MKHKLVRSLSLLLAGALQIMPMVRSMLPTVAQGVAPSTWAIIFRWSVGAAAYLGYHAVSSASSISVSPPTATIGQPYVGAITYTGGHAGSVSSISLSNATYTTFTCMGTGSSFTFAPGLMITYNGGNTASISGVPTGSSTTTNRFALKLWDGSGCSGGNSDQRFTDFVIVNSAGGSVAAAITVQPQNTISQVGVDVILSAAAIGNPVPGYYWTHNGLNIAGANTNYLLIPNARLADAGFYTLHATNSGASPAATCYLTMALTPGSNVLSLNYTNYYPAGNALTLYSLVTNVPVATNTYAWLYSGGPVGITTSNWTLTAAQVLPAKSGKYEVQFSSVVPTNSLIGTNNAIVKGESYYSYWSYGYAPAITNQPAPTNVNAGSSATFVAAARGSLNVLFFPTNVAPNYYIATNFTAPCAFWYQDGAKLVASQIYTLAPISGATFSNKFVNVSLTIPNAAASDAGSYTVVLTNFWGSITSSPAMLTVNSSGTPPSISSQPAPLTVLAGQNASFSVGAGGTAPLSYQWQKNNLDLSDGVVYSGVHTNLLNLTGVGTNNAGNYSVVITNTAGSTNSNGALLAVALPPNLTLGSGAGGNVQLSASTISNLNYVLETATNLNSTWIPVVTSTVPASGALLFTNAATNPEQFFRLRFP